MKKRGGKFLKNFLTGPNAIKSRPENTYYIYQFAFYDVICNLAPNLRKYKLLKNILIYLRTKIIRSRYL